jgi:hypothetical protein
MDQVPVAEGAGFEPAIRFPVYTLSRRAPSTARPPLLSRLSARGSAHNTAGCAGASLGERGGDVGTGRRSFRALFLKNRGAAKNIFLIIRKYGIVSKPFRLATSQAENEGRTKETAAHWMED